MILAILTVTLNNPFANHENCLCGVILKKRRTGIMKHSYLSCLSEWMSGCGHLIASLTHTSVVRVTGNSTLMMRRTRRLVALTGFSFQSGILANISFLLWNDE